MQAGVGLLVSDVMPIYMIIPRYSHNYAQFYQSLDSNSFTHCRGYTPRYDLAGDMTQLGLDVSLVTRQTISRREQLSIVSWQTQSCNPADTVM